ncbi:MAG: HAD family hydrolase [Burkholderiales bacterium]
MACKYDAVLFDLLTALIDSWTVWNRAAGSEEAGRRWRAEYLKLTYGCGAYRPYESLVAEAAESVGLGAAYADRLEAAWSDLEAWPGVDATLMELKKRHRLGIVTNCSERLGRAAASRINVPFEVVVTSERAGYYKPDPRPYRLALDELGLPAGRVLFVAGSGFDLIGTSRVGMDTYWHNRVGLALPPGAPRPLKESADITGVLGLV